MSATIIQDYEWTWREDVPLPIKILLQREGAVSSGTKAMQNLVQADFANPGGITIGAYLSDETVVVAPASLTVASVIYDTPLTGSAGPSGGWNFDTVAPATFFPSPTSVTGKNTIVELRYTLSDGQLWQVIRIVVTVLSTAGS